MSNLMLCVGRTPSQLFEWDHLDVRVYSMEELCFYIVRNRYMIGRESFTHDLVDWIEKECLLEELGISLRRRLEKGCSAEEFAAVILEYVRYNTKEEIEETRKVLREGSNLDVYEKHLARADFLVETGKYTQALDAYEGLRRASDDRDDAMRAKLLFNEGVMHAKMFCFTRAAECFRSAYELTHDPEDYLSYLAALRMRMTEKEYLDYITEDAKGYQFSMTLESAIQEAEEAYGASEAHNRLKEMTRLKTEGRRKEYYESAARVMDELKRSYRGSEASGTAS